MNELAKQNKETFFNLREGSNYLVMMTYDREEIIEFEQFKKLAVVLNDGDRKFITINDRIVNKSTIIDIAPTDRLTKAQAIERKNNPKEVFVEGDNGEAIPLSNLVSNSEKRA